MNRIALLTLVHPDFLPPVYAMAQVLENEGYLVDIITFASEVPGKFHLNENITTHIVTNHSGNNRERAKARQTYREFVKDFFYKNKVAAIFSYCEFSYLTALENEKFAKVFYFALEVTNYSLGKLITSPLGTIRIWQANTQLHKAFFLSTPSQERSGWLAGRYGLIKVPETILNTPYIPKGFELPQKQSKFIPDSFKSKVIILNTGGVNHTRSVIELIKGFEKSATNNCLIITNVTDTAYSQKVKELIENSPRKSDILLLDTISRAELLELQASCHIGICLMKLKNGLGARMIAPNKVGEYLASGLLVLGMETAYFHQFIPYHICALTDSLEEKTLGGHLDKLTILVKEGNYRNRIMQCLTELYNMKTQMHQVLKLLKSI